MAVRLELRYRGLRARTSSSWGSPGAPASAPRRAARTSASSPPRRAGTSTSAATAASRPRHAELLVEDVDDETLVADHRPLPHVLRPHRRPAAAHRALAAGARGRARPRSARSSSTTASASPPTSRRHMARHVDDYEDEWAAVLADPERLRQFVSFVNAPDDADPTLAYVTERGQRRPATPGRARRAHRRDHPGGPLMTLRRPRRDAPTLTWVAHLPLRHLTPSAASPRSSADEQVAVFRRPTTEAVRAVAPRPVQRRQRPVARDRRQPRRPPTVATPMYKQVFDLETGECLDDPAVRLPVHLVRVRDGVSRSARAPRGRLARDRARSRSSPGCRILVTADRRGPPSSPPPWARRGAWGPRARPRAEHGAAHRRRGPARGGTRVAAGVTRRTRSSSPRGSASAAGSRPPTSLGLAEGPGSTWLRGTRTVLRAPKARGAIQAAGLTADWVAESETSV